MLTSIRLENFKCFERLELQPRRITVLIGPNGAGKSSVLQALMFLRQSLGQEEPQWQGEFVNLVGFSQALHSSATERKLAIQLVGERSLDGERLDFVYRAAFSEEGLLANIGRLREVIGPNWVDHPLYVEWRRGTMQDKGIVEFKDRGMAFEVNGSPVIGKPHGRVWAQVHGPMPIEEQESVHQKQRGLLETVPDAIQSWRFGPPVRGFLQHGYELAPSALDEIHPADSYDSLASGITSSLGYEDDVRDGVAALTKRVTGVSIEHGLAEGKLVAVSANGQMGRRVPIVNEGFGTNQLTWLLYQLVKTPEGGLAGIEEPETHLHPKAIAKLGDVFVEIATKEDKQLLLATHSDHLLLSLLNNVTERKLAADDLAIYYFQLDDGKVAVRRQEVTDEGLVKGGLPGFFEAVIEHQRRRLKALSKQQ